MYWIPTFELLEALEDRLSIGSFYGNELVTTSFSPENLWHFTSTSSTDISVGTTPLQMSMTSGHRPANLQPCRRYSSCSSSESVTVVVQRFLGSACGMESRSSREYGCLGFISTCSTVPISTMLPRNMMAIR